MDKKLFLAGLLLPFAIYFSFKNPNHKSKDAEYEQSVPSRREFSSIENKIPVLTSQTNHSDETLREIDSKINVNAINSHARDILEDRMAMDDLYDFTDSDKEKIISQVIHYVDLTHINYADIEATVVALMNDQLHEVVDREEDYGFDMEDNQDAE